MVAERAFRNTTVKEMLAIVDDVMKDREKTKFIETGDADLALNVAGVGRFRGNAFKQRGAYGIILRHVKGKIPDHRGLNLPSDAIHQIASLRRGMVLVTGTTGSGKSTSLASIINIINRTRRDHIVCLEDPIEFVHEDILSTITQREIGIDSKDFTTALRALMREDPDVILIGELRDIETFEAAIHASETGHLVFSTTHTTNAMLTVDRVIDLFPPDQHQQIRTQLSYQLKAILSQRLIPSADGAGRVPAVEIMFTNPGIRSLIRDNNLSQIPGALIAGKNDHMQTFNMSLVSLINQGLITQEDAMDFDVPEKTIVDSPGFHKEWLNACKGDSTKPACNFGYSGPLSETVLLANAAYRSQSSGFRAAISHAPHDNPIITNTPHQSGNIFFGRSYFDADKIWGFVDQTDNDIHMIFGSHVEEKLRTAVIAKVFTKF
ncbi:MAG TPA: PilT/PilU family type 4a pilus ATPase [candidate division Zixibacteria bacterium]|nr:PilT/PilU family type 4a pilus ATPase [candidate division Zixibacteria bacterium]